MKSSRLTAYALLSALIVLVVWVSLFIMSDRAPAVPLQPPTLASSTISGAASSSQQQVVPQKAPPAPKPMELSGTMTLGIDEMGALSDLSIVPREVVEDSRCPLGVMCIRAGTIRVRASVTEIEGTKEEVFLLGEPVGLFDRTVTLTAVDPIKRHSEIKRGDYRFTFKVSSEKIAYKNASTDMITVTAPFPGAVVGKVFSVSGSARGSWYFEGSFPIELRDRDGRVIATAVAKAQSDWMVDGLVQFIAELDAPSSFIGPATLVLKKDNPSGIPSKDASIAFPITVEY